MDDFAGARSGWEFNGLTNRAKWPSRRKSLANFSRASHFRAVAQEFWF
jgi:hypothetical protein